MSKKGKVFRWINYVLMIAFSLACIGLCIYNKVIGDPDNRFFACIAMAVVFILPILLELIFRCRFSNFVLMCFIIFCFLSGFLGSVLNFYDKTEFGLNIWYDIFIHTLMGYAFALIGWAIVSRLEKNKKLNVWTILLFCFCFALAIELIWELMEWFADLFMGQNAQGVPIEGQNAPIVTDTDIDLLCNFSGAIIFAIQYMIGKFSKLKLGIGYLEKELCTEKVVRKVDKKKLKNIENNQNRPQNLAEISQTAQLEDEQKDNKKIID